MFSGESSFIMLHLQLDKFENKLIKLLLCSVPQVQAGEVNQTSEVNENTIAKPTDCQSCMLLLIKLANQYQNKTESKGNVDAGQFISSALEKECYKFKFASPVVSCFAILQEINLKTIANQNSIANPTDLDAKFAICSNAVHGCPAN
uniref:Saposin B-type domain-containing protein n=1 Tax=Ditylenchus dipsaci TaxID=166011 RepID=A0A915E7D4_9BILA